jgi:hypothetical protein
MAGDQHIALIDQHRIGEAELAYRLNDLLDLALGMGPRITRIRFQRTCRPVDHSQLAKRRLSPRGTLVHASEHSLNRRERHANKAFSCGWSSVEVAAAANCLFGRPSGLLKTKNAPDLAESAPCSAEQQEAPRQL